MRKKLNEFGQNVTSQHGEDGIIKYILEQIPFVPKTCVEFGAWDGYFLSNVYSLWHDKNWNAVLIEGNKKKYKSLKKTCSGFDNVKTINKWVAAEGKSGIDEICKQNKIASEIGLISIDIDSYDYYVWKNMSYLKPAIVVIEHNHTIPGYVYYKDPSDEVFLRSSAKALEDLGKQKGYKLICCTLTNSIFIKEQYFDEKVFPDMPVEYLFDYSHCSAAVLSANAGPNANIVPIYYGKVSKNTKIFNKIKSYVSVLLRKGKYKAPSKKIILHCKKFGINLRVSYNFCKS